MIRWSSLLLLLPALGVLLLLAVLGVLGMAAAVVLAVLMLGGGVMMARVPPSIKVRPKAESASQTLANDILEALPDPVLLLDRKRTVRAANSAARALLGEKVTGRDFALSMRQPQGLAAVDSVCQGKVLQAFADIAIADPVPRTFDLHATALSREEGLTELLVVALHDTTPQRQSEMIRADFVANVSHELRSPLASLSGFIETLRGPARDDGEARERFLGIMEGEALRMSRLVDDLLSLSRVESSTHRPPEETVDLSKLLDGVVAALGERASKRGSALRLTTLDANSIVPGDPDQLVSVFRNLIDNAIKYGEPEGGVDITMKPVARVPDVGGAGIAVSVVNTGEGIAPDHLPRLTERFYRVDKGRSRAMGGTGLGLAIVKHVVIRHRGHFHVVSEPGQGATFTVTLPIA